MAAQRDEIARLKGLKGRPTIKPSGMEKATEPKSGGKRVKHRGRGKVTPRVTPGDQGAAGGGVPAGSQFKGYEPYQVQDLVLTARVVRYRRERWLTPDGRDDRGAAARRHPRPFRARTAPLRADAAPPGPSHGRALVTQLQAIGVSISKRQVMRLLIDGQDDFLAETREVLRAGLETADWITVDDTGARHRGANARLHADRQRQLRLVRHHGQQEPAELPRPAARRPHRLCDQRCGAGLYA